MTYSPSAQTRLTPLQSATIYPATEFFVSQDWIEKLKKEIPLARNDSLDPDSKARQDRIIDELMFKLEAQSIDNSFAYISYMLDMRPLATFCPRRNNYLRQKLVLDALTIYTASIIRGLNPA